MNRRFALAALATFTFTALVAAATQQPAAAQTGGYTVTNLGVIAGAGSASASRARAINDSGWVVGDMPEYRLSTPPFKGWLWTPSAPNSPSGSPRALEPFDGRDRSGAYDVNNAGLIVGHSWNTIFTNSVATFWQTPDYAPKSFNDLPKDSSLAGWSFIEARSVSDVVDLNGDGAGEIYVAGRGTDGAFTGGIVWRIDAPTNTIVGVVKVSGYSGNEYSGGVNNRGQVTDGVGTGVTTDTGPWRAILGDGLSGTSRYLGTLGGPDSWGNGINDYGTVVGDSNNSAGLYRGFVWTPAQPNGTEGTMAALGTLGGTRSNAYSINNLNQIVGRSYLKGDRTQHACLWPIGLATPTDLNSLKTAGATGLELLEAYKINNARDSSTGTSKAQIIGRFYTNKADRAFLLTPR